MLKARRTRTSLPLPAQILKFIICEVRIEEETSTMSKFFPAQPNARI